MSGAITTMSCGFKSRMLLEEREQLIVQHLHLAHRAVAGMELERAIVRRDGARRFAGGIVQVENVALDLREHVSLGGAANRSCSSRRVQLGDVLEKFAAEFAEGSEQRIAARELQIELRGGAGLCGVRDALPRAPKRVSPQHSGVGRITKR